MYTFYYPSHLNNLFNYLTCMSCTSTDSLISFLYGYGFAMIHVNSNTFWKNKPVRVVNISNNLVYNFYLYCTIVWMIRKFNINTNPFEIR